MWLLDLFLQSIIDNISDKNVMVFPSLVNNIVASGILVYNPRFAKVASWIK